MRIISAKIALKLGLFELVRTPHPLKLMKGVKKVREFGFLGYSLKIRFAHFLRRSYRDPP